MHCRLIAIFAILCFAFGGGGCASKSRADYEEVLMPLQTGSVIQRRVQVKTDRDVKPPKEKATKEKPAKETKKPAPPKPEAEPEETPAPQEESTPPPERFR